MDTGKDSKALFSAARAVVNVAPYDASAHPDLVWVPAKNNNGRKPDALRIRLDPETMGSLGNSGNSSRPYEFPCYTYG